jgi:hypothetical protein
MGVLALTLCARCLLCCCFPGHPPDSAEDSEAAAHRLWAY